LRRSNELGVREIYEWHATERARVTLQEYMQIAAYETKGVLVTAARGDLRIRASTCGALGENCPTGERDILQPQSAQDRRLSGLPGWKVDAGVRLVAGSQQEIKSWQQLARARTNAAQELNSTRAVVQRDPFVSAQQLRDPGVQVHGRVVGPANIQREASCSYVRKG
jgi:hypothetical protein